MPITLEPHGIFGSNFAYSLFYVTGRQIGDEGLLSIILASHGLLVKMLICLFVFVALRPMSTAMVIAGRSVHLNTLFPGQA